MPWIRTRLVVAGMVACVMVAGRAGAQTSTRPGEDEPRWPTVQIAPFAGVQFGGSLQGPSGRNGSVDAGLAYGGTVDFRVDESWSLEVLYSRQSTEFPGPLDATVERYMAGLVEERDYGRTRFFGVALIGATRFVPGFSAYGSSALFTIGVGLGVKHLLTDHLGLRAEVRGFYAITQSGGGLFCNGGCLFIFNGSGLAQADVTAGIVLAF